MKIGQCIFHFLECGRFDLTDSLGRHTEFFCQHVQRSAIALIVVEPTGFDDAAGTVVQFIQCVGQPFGLQSVELPAFQYPGRFRLFRRQIGNRSEIVVVVTLMGL